MGSAGLPGAVSYTNLSFGLILDFTPMNTPDIGLGAIWYIVFLFSTTCHEAAHALAAKIGGDLTAFEGGQVTLNPIPHIRRSPFGMVVVPIISFLFGGWMIGWASAPYDPAWQRRYPRRSAWMALAGSGRKLHADAARGLGHPHRRRPGRVPAADFHCQLHGCGAIRS